MKDFIEVKEQLFESSQIEGLNESEIKQAEKIYSILEGYIEAGGDLNNLDEGLFSGLLGGAAGAAFGPAIGRAICNALGITRGVLYDLFTSKMVTTAIGAELAR